MKGCTVLTLQSASIGSPLGTPISLLCKVIKSLPISQYILGLAFGHKGAMNVNTSLQNSNKT